MTPTEYQSKGYKVGLQVLQPIINKAEETAFNAYVKPILPNAEFPTTESTDNDVKNATMAIAYLLMCRNNVFVTRAGAKTKNSPLQSETPYTEKVSDEQVLECGRLLDVLKSKQGADKNAEICDVAKIFFITNYFYTK